MTDLQIVGQSTTLLKVDPVDRATVNNGNVINPRSVKTDTHISLNISAMDKAEYDESPSRL
jgi:hypothetical protein